MLKTIHQVKRLIVAVSGRKIAFYSLRVSVSDFKIAGGILLFILSVVDLIFQERATRNPSRCGSADIYNSRRRIFAGSVKN